MEQSEKYIPREEDTKKRENFLSQDRQTQKQRIDEAHEEGNILNGLVDNANEAREKLLIPYQKGTNTKKTEEYARRRDSLKREIEQNPDVGKWLKIAKESLKRTFPKYMKDIDIKDLLEFQDDFDSSKIQGSEHEDGGGRYHGIADSLKQEVDINKENLQDDANLAVTLAHEFLHILSYSQASKNYRRRRPLKIKKYIVYNGITEGKFDFKNEKFINKDVLVNESITQYFAVDSLRKSGHNKYTKEILATNNIHRYIYEIGRKLESVVGRKVLEEAYFEGKLKEMTELIGEKRFKRFSDATEKHSMDAFEILDEVR